MAIIAGYQKGESFGLLGPQMAATIIETYASCQCIVIAVPREVSIAALRGALKAFFESQPPVIAFSNLGGRPDLFDLARDLKISGMITVLAGPQAGVDFAGEIGWEENPHRFRGLADHFNVALQGPAEQIIPLLNPSANSGRSEMHGLAYRDHDGRLVQQPPLPWSEKYLRAVNWDNIHIITDDGLKPLRITMGQVLQQIGCPHAAKKKECQIEYPAALTNPRAKKIRIASKGCSFCDVAVDKGFHGRLGMDTVLSQVGCLPTSADGRKIPFELINENPLPGLADLLVEVKARAISISQVNLTMRADWLAAGGKNLRNALKVARKMGVGILLSSIGFESFDDAILRNFNKGLTTENHLEAIRLIRRIKQEFPHHFGYSSHDGAIHGFIHPTPWDSPETEASIQKTIALYGLQNDILPPHSTPLIIHHASALGEWIREIERLENIRYRRHGAIIAWWEPPIR